MRPRRYRLSQKAHLKLCAINSMEDSKIRYVLFYQAWSSATARSLLDSLDDVILNIPNHGRLFFNDFCEYTHWNSNWFTESTCQTMSRRFDSENIRNNTHRTPQHYISFHFGMMADKHNETETSLSPSGAMLDASRWSRYRGQQFPGKSWRAFLAWRPWWDQALHLRKRLHWQQTPRHVCRRVIEVVEK